MANVFFKISGAKKIQAGDNSMSAGWERRVKDLKGKFGD